MRNFLIWLLDFFAILAMIVLLIPTLVMILTAFFAIVVILIVCGIMILPFLSMFVLREWLNGEL